MPLSEGEIGWVKERKQVRAVVLWERGEYGSRGNKKYRTIERLLTHIFPLF